MRIKNVVKVMNFHSLLRVDKARKEAEKYAKVEDRLRTMISTITNNRNIILDRQINRMDESKPVLNVYIGSDLGFCGAYNFLANNTVRKDSSDKIIIGKKVKKDLENVKVSCTQEEYLNNPDVVAEYIKTSIRNLSYSEINVLYNHYINAGTINWEKKRVFPFEMNEEESYSEDYISESDITNLVLNMVSTYIDFEIQITVKNAMASENIMRQNSTNDSLKKIDEIEELNVEKERKQKSIISSQKNVERYIKRRSKKKAYD